MALLMGGGSIIGYNIWCFVSRPILPQQNTSMVIHVGKTSSATSLAHRMYARGWVPSTRLWIIWMRLQGVSSQLKAGIYQLQPHETAQHLLKRIVAGDVLHKFFLIKPGMTQQQVIRALKTAPFLVYSEVDWDCLNTQNYPSLHEGLLLADTYRYDAGSHAQDVICPAYQQLNRVLQRAWAARTPVVPYHSPYELLIAASIIEKESAIASERRLISGVIVNRLRKRMPLQMDPTVIYALGDAYQGSLNHAQMMINSPYNTYVNYGLPPTPIAMPSRDAIEAARDPDRHHYLYFVAKGDGSHEFSENYVDHRQAIQRYMHMRES